MGLVPYFLSCKAIRGGTAKTEPCSFSVGAARLRSLPVHRP